MNVENYFANYHDIFLDELLGMPPQREMYHAIKLVLGVAPIAKAPYRYSFKENIGLET